MKRLPAVAGAFYPAERINLINQINLFLKSAKKISKEKLRILIVPHAGYDYSGQTGGWGFKQLVGKNYSSAIILGASHRAYFNRAAVYNKGSWQTPLGELQIDEDLADNLINQSNFIKANLAVHEEEHSLEVQLPFLQMVLKDFKIVPILLGQTTSEALKDLAKTIAKNFSEQTFLIISSDLSHYPNAKIAKEVDGETIKAIVSGNINQFNQVIQENLNQIGVDTCACGAEAIKAGMMVAQNIGISDIKLLNYANSGDISGDKSRVVGYASIGFYGEILNIKNQKKLNQKKKRQLLKIARKTLKSYLKNGKIPQVKVVDKALQKKLGAFVTLEKKGQLRGCIGEFEPKKPLYRVVQEKVVDAALHDPRFSPVQLNELKDITIEISVLSPRQKITDWQKIKLGQHGVVIKKGLNAGTFLPQVATETGWNQETFLGNLCFHKAGLPADAYKDPQTEIYIFTAQVFKENGQK